MPVPAVAVIAPLWVTMPVLLSVMPLDALKPPAPTAKPLSSRKSIAPVLPVSVVTSLAALVSV